MYEQLLKLFNDGWTIKLFNGSSDASMSVFCDFKVMMIGSWNWLNTAVTHAQQCST